MFIPWSMQDNEFTFSRTSGSSSRRTFFFLFFIFHVLWKDQPALVIENFLPFFFSFSSLYPLSIPFLKLQLLRLHIDRFRFKFRTFL